MKEHTCKLEYLEKAHTLSVKKADRLMSRMSVHFYSQLVRDGYSPQEVMAIQMEIEDEQLQEWRERVAQVRQQDQQWLLERAKLERGVSLN